MPRTSTPGTSTSGTSTPGTSTPRTLRLGTRQSALALAQSGQMARELERRHPGLEVELVKIVTRGDREKGELAKIGGKGLFTEELEAGLLDGSLDLAVHSLKDLPVRLPAGLRVAAFPERADPRDVMVSETAEDLDGLAAGDVLLTGALRRRALILARRPDVVVEGLRGNVDTRLRKWRESGSAGVILAASGLARLGMEETRYAEMPAHALDPEIMVPAPGQGILAIEVAEGSAADEICAVLDDAAARGAALAERHLVAAFGGDCTLPLAAWARLCEEDGEEDGEIWRVTGVLATPDGQRAARGVARDADPFAAAQACVAAMHEAGAEEVLELLRAGQ